MAGEAEHDANVDAEQTSRCPDSLVDFSQKMIEIAISGGYSGRNTYLGIDDTICGEVLRKFEDET